MDLSIAICTWNRADFLAQTLERLTLLHLPPGLRWEILVVNNRCTDHTDQVIEAFADRLPVRRLYEGRQGQSMARNLVLREFRGEKLVFTDDDVLASPNWVESLLEAFDQFGADVVFGRSLPVWLGGRPSWYFPQFGGVFALLDYGPEPFVVTTDQHEFFGLNLAFTRRATVDLGHYREDIGLVGPGGGGGEDTEMFDRCRTKGLKVVYQPGAVVEHMIPADRSTKSRQRKQAWRGGRANYRLMISKSRGPELLGLPRFLYRIVMEDARECARLLARGDWNQAFYREVRLIRFGALVREALRTKLTKPAPRSGSQHSSRA